MKEFFKYVLATICGILILGIVMSIMFIVSLAGMALSGDSSAKVKSNSVFTLSLNGTVQERGEEDSPLNMLLGQANMSVMGLDDIVSSIRKAKEQEDIKGIYIETNAVTFDAPAIAQEVRDAVIAIRQSKLPEPDELGSAGSFFKNPVVPVEVFRQIAASYTDVPHYVISEDEIKIPAAWLIDQCGWKGKRHGGAAVYEKQPLILVNKDHATPADIMELATLIEQSVMEKFNIQLSPEVNYI